MLKLVSLVSLIIFLVTPHVNAQEGVVDLNVTTIERDPFVRSDGENLEGFSVELWREIANDRDWTYSFTVVDSFIDLFVR